MKRRERVILGLLVVILFIGFGADTILSNYIPNRLIIRDDYLKDLEMTIFQIQATIATLGIALITILSGVSNDTIYGISMARFILQIRPNVLKHKNIITILVLFVLINYFLIILKMYNSIISVLFITVVLILFMVHEIFTVFEGRECIKSEIGNFLIKNAKNTNFLSIVFNDSLKAIENEGYLRFKENMNIITELFHKSVNYIEAEQTLREYWENNLAKIFADAFKKIREPQLKMVISNFEDIYKIISNEFRNPEKIVLWDKVYNEFLYSLKVYDLDNIEALDVFITIRWEVYKCQYFKTENGKVSRNNNGIEYLFNTIYYKILNNAYKVEKIYKPDREKILESYYNYIENDILYCHNKESIPVFMNEFKIFTKLLLDNLEEKVFDNTFVDRFKDKYIFEIKDELVPYYLTFIIYLYYLAEKEELIENAQKESSKRILDNANQGIAIFLIKLSLQGPMKKEIVDVVRNNLAFWEYCPMGEAKTTIMDSVIDEFLLFNAIYSDKNTESLKDSIKAIIGSNVLIYVSGYTGRRKNNVKNNYKTFVNKINCADIKDNEIDNDLMRLENVLFEILKTNQLGKGENEALDIKETYILEEEIQEKFFNKTTADFDVFNSKENDRDYMVGINQISIEIYSSIIKSSMDKIIDTASNFIVHQFINLLIRNNQIEKEEISNRDKKALNNLFDLIDKYNIDVNTLIGYRDWFNGYDQEREFKELEANCSKIKASKISDIVVCVDSKKISINSIHCIVEVADIDFEELKVKLEKDEEGHYLYNIVNDIFLPCEEEELKALIKNTRKIVRIKIDYQYSYSDDLSGVAMIFKPKKMAEEAIS